MNFHSKKAEDTCIEIAYISIFKNQAILPFDFQEFISYEGVSLPVTLQLIVIPTLNRRNILQKEAG